MPPLGAGDFERLYDAYYQPLCRFAFSVVRARDVAQEIVADVFANVWLQWERWPPAGGEGPYLYRAVRNRLMNHARDARRRGAREDRWDPNDAAIGTLGAAPDVAAEADDTKRRVWEAVAGLSPKAREVLTLHWQHQLSLTEIAVVLETSEGAVRVQHSRALKQLREALGDLFG